MVAVFRFLRYYFSLSTNASCDLSAKWVNKVNKRLVHAIYDNRSYKAYTRCGVHQPPEKLNNAGVQVFNSRAKLCVGGVSIQSREGDLQGQICPSDMLATERHVWTIEECTVRRMWLDAAYIIHMRRSWNFSVLSRPLQHNLDQYNLT